MAVVSFEKQAVGFEKRAQQKAAHEGAVVWTEGKVGMRVGSRARGASAKYGCVAASREAKGQLIPEMNAYANTAPPPEVMSFAKRKPPTWQCCHNSARPFNRAPPSGEATHPPFLWEIRRRIE